MGSCAVAIYFMWYNFAADARTTSAVATGVTGQVWGAKDIVGLLGV